VWPAQPGNGQPADQGDSAGDSTHGRHSAAPGEGAYQRPN
jgi:hypothetical protein